MNIELYLMPIPYQNLSCLTHELFHISYQFHTNLSYSIHEPIPYMHIMHFMPLTYQLIQNIVSIQRQYEKNNIGPYTFFNYRKCCYTKYFC